ncbi:MAG: hypothetical protein U9R66_09850 [Thermodesulfobacteriota bacterium]|nr:hypothetical protein [Thermodesulfobacteriota bacterium]
MDDKKAAYHLLELAATAAPEIEIWVDRLKGRRLLEVVKGEEEGAG